MNEYRPPSSRAGGASFAGVERDQLLDATLDDVGHLDLVPVQAQALAHFPSGTFTANAAWTVIAATVHNLLRWTSVLEVLLREPLRERRRSRRRSSSCPARRSAPHAPSNHNTTPNCDLRPPATLPTSPWTGLDARYR
jgi:hypothetical protein